MKKTFLEISQNSQENACVKKEALAHHTCFLVNFVKFLRTPILQNTSGRLLLELILVHELILFLAPLGDVSRKSKMSCPNR